MQGAAGAATLPERRSGVSAPSDTPTINPSQTSASIKMTVLPCETRFDAREQATEHCARTSEGMAVINNGTQPYWKKNQTKGQEWAAVRRVVK